MSEIDIKKLRNDLLNYFGTAMKFMPMAMMEITRVEKATKEELIKIAKENGFDLSQYEVFWR